MPRCLVFAPFFRTHNLCTLFGGRDIIQTTASGQEKEYRSNGLPTPAASDTSHSIMSHFTSFEQLQHWLDKRGLFHMDLGLERTDKALDRLGLRNPNFAVAHMVGTNGKGSTTTFLASLCAEHGAKAGVYTSPHFITIRERIRIGRDMLPPTFWVEQANLVMDTTEDLGLTYFEFLTVLAVQMFATTGVDAAIMEAGLGGTYDAVCSMRRDLLCLTPIGLDHQAVLGNTITEIATDKAGAMRKDMPVFSAPQVDEAAAVISQRAATCGARLHTDLPPLPAHSSPSLAGPHQQTNARLALAAWNELSRRLHIAPDTTKEIRALGTAFIPGRLQHISGLHISNNPVDLLIDGAHNPHALYALQKALPAMNFHPDAIVFACLKDKDMQTMGPLVRSLTHGPIIVPYMDAHERTADPEVTARHIGGQVQTAPGLARALEKAAQSGGKVLVCGSLYLLSEFYRLWPDQLDTTPQE